MPSLTSSATVLLNASTRMSHGFTPCCSIRYVTLAITVDELSEYARVCRVERVMRPYLQAITS